MIELRLRHDGGGQLVPASRSDLLACQQLPRGEVFNVKLTRPQSGKQRNTLHLLFQRTHETQKTGEVFPTWRQLKTFVLIQAGHCEVDRLPPGSINKAAAAILRKRHGDLIDFTTNPKTGVVHAKTVKTTSDLSMDEMRVLLDKCIEIVLRDFLPGTELTDLLREIGAEEKPKRKRAA